LPDEAAYFKDQAERCEKLAREIEDPAIRERMVKLAGEYARRSEAKPPQPPRSRQRDRA
jgi:hypothetical protein